VELFRKQIKRFDHIYAVLLLVFGPRYEGGQSTNLVDALYVADVVAVFYLSGVVE